MHYTDVLLSGASASASAYFVYLGAYPQAVFTFLIFLMLLTFMSLHYITQAINAPQPRVNIPVEMLKEKEKEEEE